MPEPVRNFENQIQAEEFFRLFGENAPPCAPAYEPSGATPLSAQLAMGGGAGLGAAAGAVTGLVALAVGLAVVRAGIDFLAWDAESGWLEQFT